MEYDNNNTGVVFEKQNNQELEGTGLVTENGERKRIAMIKSDLPDGSTVRDVFVYAESTIVHLWTELWTGNYKFVNIQSKQWVRREKDGHLLRHPVP